MDVTWEKLPDEPNRWYDRFDMYRLLGADRTLEAAFRQHSGGTGRANRHWFNAMRRWDWKRRAEAWDAAQRAEIRQKEEARRLGVRQERIERIDYHKRKFDLGLVATNLDNLTEAEARRMVTTLLKGFAECVRMERLEYGEVTERIGEDDGYPDLSPEVRRRLALVYGLDDEADEDDDTGEEDG